MSYQCPKNMLGEREPPPKKQRKRKKQDERYICFCFCFLFFPSHYYRSHQCLHPHTRNYLVRSRRKETLVRYRISGTELQLIRTLRAQMLLNSAWPVAGFQTGLFCVQIPSNLADLFLKRVQAFNREYLARGYLHLLYIICFQFSLVLSVLLLKVAHSRYFVYGQTIFKLK